MTAIHPEVTNAEALATLAAEHLAGEFRLGAHLGQGAWGERFEAEDLHRAEGVVLTLLPPIEGEEWREEERFLEALRAVTLLDHPHLAPVRAYGVSGPLRWFATLATSDPTLGEMIAAQGALPMPQVRRIAQQLASALDQAHRRGLVHGALSPHDVRVDAHGWVRVEEVGIGAVIAPPEEGADQLGLAELVRYALTGGEEGPLPSEVDASVYAAIVRATRPRVVDRFRDLLDFVAALDGVQTTAQPIRPTIPVGKRIGAADWNELLDTEPEAPLPAPTPWARRSLLLVALLLLITAAIPMGKRLVRPSTEGKISYPRPSIVDMPVEVVAPALPPAAPSEDPAPPAPVVRRAPAPAPRATPTRTPAPTLPTPLPPVPTATAADLPGTLAVSSTPWGELTIDGTPMGNTPQAALSLVPGHHQVRVSRDGYVPFEIDLIVRPGETVRLTQLVLKELKL